MGKKMYSCVVLSGGMSTRMGQDKGSMIIQEKPMILHILEKLNYKINDAVIVLNNQERIRLYKDLLNQYCDGDIENYFSYRLKFVEDDVKSKGPISGIMTGLKNIETDYALILPCDSPFISIKFIKKMFRMLDKNKENERLDAIIPFHKKANKARFKNNDEFNFENAEDMPLNQKIHNCEPLHSIYKKDNLNHISKLLNEDNLYVKSFIISLENIKFIEIDNKFLYDDDFENINRKEDLENYFKKHETQ